MNCLLVDDEPGIREGLAVLLRRQGLIVRTAADCAEAVRALAEQRFDVVVSDWRLPDGLAASFLAGCPCPVIAMSGHPEEVVRSPAVHTVLAKPAGPARLFAAIRAAARPAAAELPPLPLDVQAAIESFVAGLPPGSDVELHDDGTFVAVRVALPPGATAAPAATDGDLRWLPGADRRCELRLCRDGRPDVDVPVVPAGAPWPGHDEFAVDYDGCPPDPAGFFACLDRVRAARAAGRRVHLLNVPAGLRALAASHGRGHDLPMRTAVGPRLTAEYADLWSHS